MESKALQIRLFAGFEVLLGGVPMAPLRSKREQWLLALLVLKNGRETSRRWLAATLWPDNDEEQALFYLRKALSNLRKALGGEADRIVSPSAGSVRLDLTDAYADVVEFDRLAGTGQARQAIEQYRGPFLPDCQEEWALAERDQRHVAYTRAMEEVAEQSDAASAVRWLRLLVAADPYRESAHRALMQALSDCGDRAAVTVVYRELCNRLHNDLNASPSPETETLYQELRRREKQEVAPTSRPADSRRHLPVPLTDLVGRSREIAAILGWMSDRRLVSLVGAGGIGKTRLAIAAAEASMTNFSDGVWFVDLAPVEDPALIAGAIAGALTISEEGSRPVSDTLNDSLHDRHALLVLDNCEHVVEACSELVGRLLANCSQLAILVTSRQPLHVNGEQVYRVPGLAVPEPRADVPISELREFEAVKLFVDRASRVDSGFQLSARNAESIVEICRQLDGIPLAIELAAARLRSLSVKEVAERLDQRFRLLTMGNRSTIARQQTLRATIDWSYDLLDERERALFRRLSVFAGGWTLEAAERVCSDELVARDDVLDLLARLADKSLVIVDDREGRTRYDFLDTVRRYALDRRLESSEGNHVRHSHLHFFLAIAEESQPFLKGTLQASWLNRLESEHENFRAAMNWSIECGDGQAGLCLASGLSRFWELKGHLSEGRERLRVALLAGTTGGCRANALHAAGILANRQGDTTTARRFHEESLSIRREVNDPKGIAASLNNLGIVAHDQGDYETAKSYHEQSLSIRRALGDLWEIAASLTNLGIVVIDQGDLAAARSLQEESLAIRRRLADRWSISNSLCNLGYVVLKQGDYSAARVLFEEGLSISRELGMRQAIANSLENLASAVLGEGDFARARGLYLEALGIQGELGDRFGAISTLEGLARLGDARYATVLWGSAERMRGELGAPRSPADRDRYDREVESARESLNGDFEAAWAEGEALGFEEAVSWALDRSAQ